MKTRATRATRISLLVGAAVLSGCWSVPDTTPAGTVVGSWTYDGKGTPEESTTKHVDTFATPGGVRFEIQWSSGNVKFPDGKTGQLPLDLKAVVKSNPGGWHAPSTSSAPPFEVGDPLNLKGDPRSVLSIDVTIFLNRGHRELGGTRFDNETLMIRLHGDGHAKELKEVATGPGSSTIVESD